MSQTAPWRGILAAAAVVVLLLAAGGAGWLVFRGHAGHHVAGGPGHRARAAAASRGSSGPGSSSPATSPADSPSALASVPASSVPASSAPVPADSTTPPPDSPAPGGPPTTPVALGSGVGRGGSEARLDSFASDYFTAINDHDYQAYIALLAPDAPQIPTPAQFSSGYGSTSDSDATLVSAQSLAGGGAAIGLSFTSHQAAGQSKTGTTCTEWRITLYLEPSGGSYLIGRPPPWYHSSYRACS